MIRPAVALLLSAALAAGACGRDAGPSKAAGAAPADASPLAGQRDWDRDNLLSLIHGAGVIARTAEFSFESSAAHAIDGDGVTMWSSPPEATRQTLTFVLGAPARIRSVGKVSAQPPETITFETSTDGTAWTPLVTMSPSALPERQTIDVEPRDASFLRVHTEAPSQRFATLGSVLVLGRETAAARQGDIAGCWTINGRAARFERDGARVRGVIDGETPIQIDGGTAGRAVRAMWVEAPLWGYALLTVSPDGQSITGVTWHQEVNARTAGDGWMGTRGDCATTGIDSASVRERFLERSSRYHLYGLQFDSRDRLDPVASRAALDELRNILANPVSQRLRIVAHEFGEPAPDKNSTRAAARLQSLRAALLSRGVAAERLELVPAGSDPEGLEVITLTQHLMNGSVDLQRVTR